MNTITGTNATISDPASFFRGLSESIDTSSSSQHIERAEPTPPRLSGSAPDANDLRNNIQSNVTVLLNAIDRVAASPSTAEPQVHRGIGEAIRIIDGQLGLLQNTDPALFSVLNQAFESSLNTLNAVGYGYDKSGFQS